MNYEPLKIEKMDTHGSKGSKKGGFQWLLLLLILLGFGASAYLGWMQQQLSKQTLKASTYSLAQQKQDTAFVIRSTKHTHCTNALLMHK